MAREKNVPAQSQLLMTASFGAVLLAGVGALGYDLYLASTQWILIAILLASWAVYGLLLVNFRQ